MRHVALMVLSTGVLAVTAARGEIAKPNRPQSPIVDFRQKEAALDEVWDKMPMAARRVLFVTASVKQFGAYQPRGDNAFHESDKVVSYIEPVGFVFRDIGDGVMSYGFKVGLIAKKADGTVLFDKPDYAELDSRTRSRKHDVEFDSSLDIKGLAPGSYTLDFAFSDLNSDKRMNVTQTFRVIR